MPKKRFVSGVIDVVTIIGVLFLIVTLGVGTYVVANKDSKLNLGSRAKAIIEGVDIRNPELQKQIKEVKQKQKEREEDNEGGNNNPDPVSAPPPTSPITTDNCYTDCINISGGTPGECNMACGQSTYTVPGGGNQILPKNYETVLPEQADVSATAPLTNGCNLNGNEISQDIVVVNGTGDYRRCGSDGQWTQICKDGQKCELADVTKGAVPQYLLTEYNKEITRLSDSCESGGGVWLGNECGSAESKIETVDLSKFREEDVTKLVTKYSDSQGNPVGTSNLYIDQRVVTIDPKFKEKNPTNLITEYRDTKGNLVFKDVAPLAYQNYRTVEKTDDGFIRDFTAIIRNVNTNEILSTLTKSINTNDYQPPTTNPPTIPAYQQRGFLSLSECLADPRYSGRGANGCYGNVDNPNYVEPVFQANAYAFCNKAGATAEEIAKCNQTLTTINNIPIVDRYIDSYANQNIAYNYIQMGYESVSDCVEKTTSYADKLRCNGYQPSKEQLTSSVALGSALTAGGAVITATGGAATGALSLTQAIGLGMAGMSTYQLGTTTDTCITEGYSDNCRTQLAWTLLSYANIGSSALQGAYQASSIMSGANTFINAVNVITDVVDIGQSCYASGFGCTMAYVGIFFDVGQGASDFGLIEAIAKNINFSNVANNPLAEVNFQSPNQLQLDAPVSNVPRGIDPNLVTDVFPDANGTIFSVADTSTTALAVAPHLNIAQADEITATILDEIPAARPQDSPQEIAGLLMAPEQPINVTGEFAGLTNPKVEVEVGGDKLSIPLADNKGFAGIIDEILNPPLAAFNPNFRWLMNIEPPKFIANIGDWVNRNIGNNPIINRLIGKPEDIKLRPNEVSIENNINQIDINGNLIQPDSSEYITLYKGISNFNENGPILPGGLATITNARTGIDDLGNKIEIGRYPTGSGQALSTPEEVVRHVLLGDSSKSNYSSWTPNIENAKSYAGEKGDVIVIRVKNDDPRLVDIKNDLQLDDFFDMIENPKYIEAIKNIKTELSAAYLQANPNDSEGLNKLLRDIDNTIFDASRRLDRMPEILIEGEINNYQVLSQPSDPISLFPSAGVWDGAKKGWNNFVESKWNPLNWIGGGSPAIDPVAVNPPVSDVFVPIGRNNQEGFFNTHATVSRNHGEIKISPNGTMTYRDTGSTAGSSYRSDNGEFIPVPNDQVIIITPDTEIRLGNSAVVKVVNENGIIKLIDVAYPLNQTSIYSQASIPIGKSHQTDFFSGTLDSGASKNHGEVRYNEADGSLIYIDKDSNNGTYYRENSSGEFIKLEPNKPLAITPQTEIRLSKNGLPFRIVNNGGAITLIDASNLGLPKDTVTLRTFERPDQSIIARNTEIINDPNRNQQFRDAYSEQDEVIVDDYRYVDGFMDNQGNLNIGRPPTDSNITYYPVRIGKKAYANVNGPDYIIFARETNTPDNIKALAKYTENSLNMPAIAKSVTAPKAGGLLQIVSKAVSDYLNPPLGAIEPNLARWINSPVGKWLANSTELVINRYRRTNDIDSIIKNNNLPEPIQVKNSQLENRIDLDEDGYQFGSQGDVYKAKISVNGELRDVAIKIYITGKNSPQEIIDEMAIEVTNSILAKKILGDKAVDFYGVVQMDDGRFGIATELIKKTNTVNQQTVNDLTVIQENLLKNGYYISDFDYLVKSDGTVKVFDFFKLTRITDDINLIKTIAKDLSISNDDVLNNLTESIYLYSSRHSTAIFSPNRSAQTIAEPNSLVFDRNRKYVIDDIIQIQPTLGDILINNSYHHPTQTTTKLTAGNVIIEKGTQLSPNDLNLLIKDGRIKKLAYGFIAPDGKMIIEEFTPDQLDSVLRSIVGKTDARIHLVLEGHNWDSLSQYGLGTKFDGSITLNVEDYNFIRIAEFNTTVDYQFNRWLGEMLNTLKPDSSSPSGVWGGVTNFGAGVRESFSNFWQNNIYSWETGFLPNWTNVGVNPITNLLFGNPRLIVNDLSPSQRLTSELNDRLNKSLPPEIKANFGKNKSFPFELQIRGKDNPRNPIDRLLAGVRNSSEFNQFKIGPKSAESKYVIVIRDIGTKPEASGQGQGKILLDALEKSAKEIGIDTIVAENISLYNDGYIQSNISSNRPIENSAYSFWLKQGYQPAIDPNLDYTPIFSPENPPHSMIKILPESETPSPTQTGIFVRSWDGVKNWWDNFVESDWNIFNRIGGGSGSPAGDPVTGSNKIVNTTVYSGPDLEIISRSEADVTDPIYYKYIGNNQLGSIDNNGKYTVTITEQIGTGGEGKIELGTIKNNETNKSIQVAIKSSLLPKDGQKMVNEHNLFDKIERILEAEGRPDLKSRVVRSLGIIQDTNGNPTGYIRSYTEGRPIWQGGRINGKLTATDIKDFEDLFLILDKHDLSPYDITLQNFIGKPGEYVLSDLTPKENVKNLPGRKVLVGHYIDPSIVDIDYTKNRLEHSQEVRLVDGRLFYDTHSSDSALENFRKMVKYQNSFIPKPKLTQSGQVFRPFLMGLSVSIAGLYYLDQYFDLGITDSFLASIYEALRGESSAESINIPYIIWQYTHNRFIGIEVGSELSSNRGFPSINKDFESTQIVSGGKSNSNSCELLGENFLNESDCKSTFSFGSKSCDHPYYNNEQKYCCPIGKYHSQKSIFNIVTIPICADDNPKNLYECSTTFSGICSTDSSDHFGSTNCWSSLNHIEVWCCGSNELNSDGSCKDVVPRSPGWQDI